MFFIIYFKKKSFERGVRLKDYNKIPSKTVKVTAKDIKKKENNNKTPVCLNLMESKDEGRVN